MSQPCPKVLAASIRRPRWNRSGRSFEDRQRTIRALALRIEVRNYRDDTATLEKQFTDLRDGTLDATVVPELGDVAFSSKSPTTSLLQIRSEGYLLTLSSRSDGKLKPIPLDTLKLLGASGLEQLP